MTMNNDKKIIKGQPTDEGDTEKPKARKFNIWEGMNQEQKYLLKALIVSIGKLRNNADLYYDMQMRMRKAVLATDNIALWDDIKNRCEMLNTECMERIENKINDYLEKQKPKAIETADKNEKTEEGIVNLVELRKFTPKERARLKQLYHELAVVLLKAENIPEKRRKKMAEPFLIRYHALRGISTRRGKTANYPFNDERITH